LASRKNSDFNLKIIKGDLNNLKESYGEEGRRRKRID